MKFILGLIAGLFLFIIIVPVLVLGYFGFIPGLSPLLGSNKPRNLGITYTETDRATARSKSKVEYGSLPPSTPPEQDWQFSGSHPIATSWSSSEMTSLMNTRPWKNFAFENIQAKFNGDGSGEFSGTVNKSKLPGYLSRLGVPKEATEFIQKFVPDGMPFYLKITGSLTNNTISAFEPQSLELGRMPIPLSMILSDGSHLTERVYAVDVGGMTGELSKVQNKKALIVEFLNGIISKINGFYAKSAYFADNKVVFDGTLPDKELTAK